MEHLVECGLSSSGVWHDFLTKGCYDQRLLLYIGAFIFDINYIYVLDTRPDAGKYGYENNEMVEVIRNLPDVIDIPSIWIVDEEMELCDVADQPRPPRTKN